MHYSIWRMTSPKKKSQCDSYTWYLSVFSLWHWVLLKIRVTLAQLWYFHGVALFISAHSLGGPSPVLVLTGVWIYFNRPLMGSVCQQLPTCYSLPHTGWYTSANGPTVCLCANIVPGWRAFHRCECSTGVTFLQQSSFLVTFRLYRRNYLQWVHHRGYRGYIFTISR